jgi:hypothetical protein
MNETNVPPSSSEIRKRGCRMFAGGALVFGAILYLMYWLSAHQHRILFPVVGAAFPFVFICVGFIEALTGSPYLRLADAWMRLAGWQRGVLGTFIVVASLVFIILGVTACVTIFT